MQKLNLYRFAQTVILIHKNNSKPSNQHRSSYSPHKGNPLPLLKHKFSNRFNINLILAISNKDIFPQVFEYILRWDSFLVYELYLVFCYWFFVQLLWRFFCYSALYSLLCLYFWGLSGLLGSYAGVRRERRHWSGKADLGRWKILQHLQLLSDHWLIHLGLRRGISYDIDPMRKRFQFDLTSIRTPLHAIGLGIDQNRVLRVEFRQSRCLRIDQNMPIWSKLIFIP